MQPPSVYQEKHSLVTHLTSPCTGDPLKDDDGCELSELLFPCFLVQDVRARSVCLATSVFARSRILSEYILANLVFILCGVSVILFGIFRLLLSFTKPRSSVLSPSAFIASSFFSPPSCWASIAGAGAVSPPRMQVAFLHLRPNPLFVSAFFTFARLARARHCP